MDSMSAILKKIDGKYILLSETNQIVYFIEDLDTHEWYYNTLRLRFAHTTAEEQYSYPKEQYWTKDPLCAMSCDSKEIMGQILDGMITRKDCNIMTDKYGEFKRLEITEHEFVINPKIIEGDLNIEDIEAQIKGYSLIEMAKKYVNTEIRKNTKESEKKLICFGFVEGASAIEELNKDKKYTKSDLETALKIGFNYGKNFKYELTQKQIDDSLYNLTPTEFPCTYEEINGKIKVTILK